MLFKSVQVEGSNPGFISPEAPEGEKSHPFVVKLGMVYYEFSHLSENLGANPIYPGGYCGPRRCVKPEAYQSLGVAPRRVVSATDMCVSENWVYSKE